jgi:ABC-type multidrug transport system fused ATPase/permease subunit
MSVNTNRVPVSVPRFRLGTLLFVVAILALLLVVAIQEVQIIGQQAEIRQMTRDLDGYFGEQAKGIKVVRELQDYSRELQDIIGRSRSERELQDIMDRFRSATDKLHK